MKLAGKSAIVTGGASGFGAGIVRRFAAEGARVFVADIDIDHAKALADELGDSTCAVRVDLTDSDDVESLVQSTIETAGGIDILVNNAGIGHVPERMETLSEDVFDRIVDGLNRLPRPMLAFGSIGLMVAAMVDPIWFAARMQGIALVPEPLWWLMGAIVSFYFGSRHQAKGQEFQRSIAETMSRAGQVTSNIRALEALDAGDADLENALLAIIRGRIGGTHENSPWIAGAFRSKASP